MGHQGTLHGRIQDPAFRATKLKVILKAGSSDLKEGFFLFKTTRMGPTGSDCRICVVLGFNWAAGGSGGC